MNLTTTQRLIADSMEFHYFNGGLTPLKQGHHTPWRSMPLTALISLDGAEGQVELETGEILVIPEGSVFVAAALTHRFLPLGAKRAISRWNHVEFRVLSTLDVLSLFDFPRIFDGQPAAKLIRACERLSSLNREGSGLDFRMIAAEKKLGFEMLDTILSQASWRTGALDFLERASRITPALTYIEEHLAESLTAEAVARTVGLSVPHFYALFKGIMGMPPLAHQRRRRLDRARVLLTSSNRQVGEIACAVGFCDPYHFSKMFKEAFGISPSEYRLR